MVVIDEQAIHAATIGKLGTCTEVGLGCVVVSTELYTMFFTLTFAHIVRTDPCKSTVDSMDRPPYLLISDAVYCFSVHVCGVGAYCMSVGKCTTLMLTTVNCYC